MAFDRPLSHASANSGERRFLGPALILLAAAVAIVPILIHGPFCGDDMEFHAVSWFEVQQGWLHGIAYPHWMTSANYGAGEPRFMFYPPLTWILGAALGFVLPWQFVLVAMIFLCLAATGLAARALALKALDDAPATLAGCAALFSGFALFTAYERTAFAELTGGFWIPLLLLFSMRDRQPAASLLRRALDGSTLPLALIVAGCWLSDGPLGLMASYLLAAISLTQAALARSFAPVLRAFMAATAGIALAGFFLIPAAHEQGWVDLRAAADYPVFKIENNWLFARHAGAFWIPFDNFLHRASMIAASMIAVALLSALFLFVRYRLLAPWKSSSSSNEPKSDPFTTHWWMALALIPAAVLFLQFPVSRPLWDLLPKLRFLQYPWRWTLIVEAPMAIFFAAAIWPSPGGARLKRNAVALICAIFFLAATVFAGSHFLRLCKEGDTVADLFQQFQSDGGLEGTDEYEPPDSDHWKIATGLPGACFSTAADTTLGISEDPDGTPSWRPDQGSCTITATAQLRKPNHIRIDMVAPRSGYLILRLLSFPAWRISVNGQIVQPADPRDDGLIVVPVPQGNVNLAVDWTTTPDVVAGRWVTAFGLLLAVGLGLLERARPRLRL